MDRATAVFKTMDAKGAGESTGEEPADDATRVFAVAKSAKSAEAAKSEASEKEASEKEAAEPPADQPTAVFKLGTDTDPKAGDAKKADAKTAAKTGDEADEKSDAKKADEKPAAKDAGAKAKVPPRSSGTPSGPVSSWR
ncbi:hypothetical protein O1L55_31960 [Streptomyces albulus]|nr:hypothetical protein [Streptomyces noursei]